MTEHATLFGVPIPPPRKLKRGEYVAIIKGPTLREQLDQWKAECAARKSAKQDQPDTAPIVPTSAVISPCGTYRYVLTRTWSLRSSVVFVMLNPSTADAEQDDPTIRRCVAFAKLWGHGGIVVVNLFAFRATDPAELGKASDAVGPDNDTSIDGATAGRRIVAAWGAHGGLNGRERAVMRLLAGRLVECLGTTRQGHPRHPLYLPAATEPSPFKMGRASA